MKVSIKKAAQDVEDQVIIQCYQVTEKIKSIVRFIQLEDDVLTGYKDEQVSHIALSDIFFIEAIDNKVFAYTKKNVYELKIKLYEFEETYGAHKFLRCSKSFVINLLKISHVKPLFNGRLTATLYNGEEVIISRQYVPVLKKYLAGGVQ